LICLVVDLGNAEVADLDGLRGWRNPCNLSKIRVIRVPIFNFQFSIFNFSGFPRATSMVAQPSNLSCLFYAPKKTGRGEKQVNY
jgi:hypothetical protein